MRIPVRIGPEEHTWRLPGSGALEDWLAAQPWDEAHTPLVARTPRTMEDDLHGWLLGEVRRADTHEDHVGLLEIPTRDARSCREALARWLEIGDTSTRGLAVALNRMARSRPRIFLVLLEADHAPAEWSALLADLQDVDSKLEDPGPLAFILATSAISEAVAAQCRLDIGWPAPAFEGGPAPRSRWGAYVHERVAWHCGGQLELVREVGDLVSTLARGDDVALEAVLDQHARASLARVEEPLLDRLRMSVSASRHHPELLIPAGLVGLESSGARPAPWLARGLLREVPDHLDRRQLESLVVCRPLAGRLLGRCIGLEAQLRDRLLPDASEAVEDPQAARTVKRLLRDSAAIEHQLEPKGRVRTLEPKEMASMHSLLEDASMPSSKRKRLHRLRLVRNALAHGSGASWKAVEVLAELEELVGEM